MPFFQKKLTIEARQLTNDNLDEIIHWIESVSGDGRCIRCSDTSRPLVIRTLEVNHEAAIGDWIIKGVKGEFYPCKPDIFEMTYRPITAMRPQQQTEQKSFRPPIGIEPDYIWKTKRLHELVLAASRYIEAGKGMNVTWFLEMHTLIGDLHIYHQQQKENNK